MTTPLPDIESLAGKAGTVQIAIKPAPCRGVLAYNVVTRPLAICLGSDGVDVHHQGAFIKYGVMFCLLNASDLATAIPAVKRYLIRIGLRHFARFGYEIDGELGVHDADAEGSFNEWSERTAWDRLKAWWDQSNARRKVLHLRGWIFWRRAAGDLSRAFFAASVAFGLAGWLAATLNHESAALWFIAASGLVMGLALVMRPIVPREVIEKHFSEGLEEIRKPSEAFKAKLAQLFTDNPDEETEEK